MFATLLNVAKGASAVLFLGINTIVMCLILFVFAFFKFISPTRSLRDFFTRILHRLTEFWTGLNNGLWSLYRNTQWDVQVPESLDRNGTYLVSSNHQSWVDILALQKALNRKIPLLTFFIKQELIYVPFLGQAWWALDMPFMNRPSREEVKRNPALKGKDLESARKACEKFKSLPVSMMSFAEGTRFSRAKAESGNSPYENLLRPKVGGIGMVLYALGDKLQSMIDVTIVYPKQGETDYTPTFWQLVTGQIPNIIVRARELEIPRHLLGRNFRTDRDIRKELEDWISQVWLEKDALLTQLKAS